MRDVTGKLAWPQACYLAVQGGEGGPHALLVSARGRTMHAMPLVSEVDDRPLARGTGDNPQCDGTESELAG